jgi:hypothetical protein
LKGGGGLGEEENFFLKEVFLLPQNRKEKSNEFYQKV